MNQKHIYVMYVTKIHKSTTYTRHHLNGIIFLVLSSYYYIIHFLFASKRNRASISPQFCRSVRLKLIPEILGRVGSE